MANGIRTPTMTEKQLQGAVMNLAKLLNWRAYHPWMSVKSAAGYPDCTLVRGGRLIYAELKSEVGQLSAAQREWLEELGAVPGVEVYVWYPRDWHSGEIGRVLR